MEPINNFETQNPIPDIQIPTLPSTPTPNKNIFKLLFFIFLGIFLIISSIYLYLWIKSDQQTPNSQTETQNQNTETITPTLITTVVNEETNTSSTSSSISKDWKTYTNSTYKYTISYPSTYQVKETTKNLISVGTPEMFKLIEESPSLGTNLEVTVYSSLSEASNNSPKVKTLKDLAINMTDPPEQNYKEITIGGVSGFTVTTDYPDTRIYLQRGNQIYYIFDGSLDNNSIEKQIINTLNFN